MQAHVTQNNSVFMGISWTLHCGKYQYYKREEQSLVPASWLLLGGQIYFKMT